MIRKAELKRHTDFARLKNNNYIMEKEFLEVLLNIM